MKKQLTLSIIVVKLFLLNSVFAENINQIQIKHIVVGPQEGDKPSNFSINILLNNGNTKLNNWQLGFYMPRNFRITNKSNLNLTMKVCEVPAGKCAKLVYEKTPFTSPDASTVFTTIIKPTENYPLLVGKNYQISLLHNSSRGPQNYSSFPQNFFIANDGKVTNLITTPSLYSITDYNSRLNHQLAQKRIANNWQNSSKEASNLNVIPDVKQIQQKADSAPFQLQKGLVIHDLSKLPTQQLNLWQQTISNDLNITPTIDTHQPDKNGILLEKSDDNDNPEGYQIEINSQHIKISASHPAGFFYALQTLRQLWFKSTSLPAMLVNDTPRFMYRGVMLDVARHYLSVTQLENFIDIMASLKLNTLHLHLSDDEAFRLELSAYPELSQIAAWRGYGKPIGPLAFPQHNLGKNDKYNVAQANDEYGGGYDQEDIKELINYANNRQITIIPEIDIPAHSRALMKALPNIFFEEDDPSEYAGYGDNTLPVCAFNQTNSFGEKFTTNLTKLLNDTATLFNNQTTLYAINNELSIGGDEVFKGTWSKSPMCSNSPWKNMDELAKEHYFFKLLSQKEPISKLKLSGWQEFIIDNDGNFNDYRIAKKQIAHVWVWGNSKEAKPKAITLANNNYPVVIAYSDLLYIDLTYTPEIKEPGLYWATKNNDTYAVLSSAIAANQTMHASKNPAQIQGLEAALWADVIPSYHQARYMTLPKLTGLAEAAWNSNGQNWSVPPWQSLARRLGCGDLGYLAYLKKHFAANYRGDGDGIKLEAPMACYKKSETK